MIPLFLIQFQYIFASGVPGDLVFLQKIPYDDSINSSGGAANIDKKE
jgi:hypothetical protein